MQLGKLFDWLVQQGISADPRANQDLMALAEQRKKAVVDSKDRAVKMADDCQWDNPYGDTRILYGNRQTKILRAMVGIDIDGSELLLADRWREGNRPIDLVIAHHPEGRAQVQLHQVMKVQEDLMEAAGVPVNVAEAIMSERMSEVRRAILPVNHQKNVDLARLLDIPFLCVHSPADNQAQKFLSDYLLEKRIGTENQRKVQEIIDALLDLPEFQMAAKYGLVPQVVAGNNKHKAGKLYIKMNGGTAGPDKSIEELVKAGVGTMVCMHIPEAQRKKAAELHLRVVVAGHMPCDSLGLNLLMDGLEGMGVEIIPCGGFLRYRR